MKILVACEFSGTVRDAFRANGHEAWSCDLLPDSNGSPFHLQGDVTYAIQSGNAFFFKALKRHVKWDALIGFPECTFVCGSGIHWNNRGRGWEKTEQAVTFFRSLIECDIPLIALENPVGILSSRIRKPNQTIQPYEFGEDASKRTCLWLKGFQNLKKDPRDRVAGRLVEWPRGSGKIVERWANQTDSGQNKLGPSEDRWALRSITYKGIAKAMADQWGGESKPAIQQPELF